jgi:hypothetical protein
MITFYTYPYNTYIYTIQLFCTVHPDTFQCYANVYRYRYQYAVENTGVCYF